MVDRTFKLTTAEQFDRLLAILRRMQLPLEVIARPWHDRRTNEQNARLWNLHTLAGQHTGYSPDEMHEEALCKHFGYTEKKMLSGWIKKVPLKRSSLRNKKEFREFMDATEMWYASEFGVWLDAQ